ncbi:helix-turn-helix domain-containing protein [Clostridiales bacterium]|nr:helix-turn-helix domain-containing protein [Clostridiales bacterium]
MGDIIQRIVEVMKDKGLKDKDLCEYAGIKQSTFATWKQKGRDPKMEYCIAIAEFLNVSTNYILQGEESDNTGTVQGVRIPVLGTIVAGIPIDAIEEILDYEEITPEMAACGEYFGLRVKGSSMEPRICEGDVVIIRQQPDIESGEIAAVIVNGNEATLKKVVKQENGITLVAFNTSVYEPRFYTCEEIENLPIRIAGKVVELRAKF